jgi:quercetin dioxygenase-like cupin family protein
MDQKKRAKQMKSLKIVVVFCLTVVFATQVWAQEEKSIAAKELVKSSLSWDGNSLPNYPEGKPEITILKITIPSGAQLPLHEHPVINAGVLLSGELTVVTTDNKTLHLKAGDPIVEVVDTWHYGRNEGETPAEIIVFYAGVSNKPITVKQEQ